MIATAGPLVAQYALFSLDHLTRGRDWFASQGRDKPIVVPSFRVSSPSDIGGWEDVFVFRGGSKRIFIPHFIAIPLTRYVWLKCFLTSSPVLFAVSKLTFTQEAVARSEQLEPAFESVLPS